MLYMRISGIRSHCSTLRTPNVVSLSGGSSLKVTPRASRKTQILPEGQTWKVSPEFSKGEKHERDALEFIENENGKNRVLQDRNDLDKSLKNG